MGEGDQGMAAMDEAFADDGTDQGTDDPMGAALDDSAAASDAGGAAGGQGTGPDPMADIAEVVDPGTVQTPDDDQSGGLAG